MKIGVIVGRFQTLIPHLGHMWLYDQVKTLSDQIVIFVGKSRIPLTSKNPLDSSYIVEKIKGIFPGVYVQPLDDNQSDLVWSRNLDEKLIELFGDNFNQKTITLYGCRDSFIPHYKGQFRTQVLDSPYTITSTNIRKRIASEYLKSNDFNKGIIYTVENKFPVPYPTVDIAILKILAGQTKAGEILLGRKKTSKDWCFPGGFVDVTDKSLESAASRELKEEVPGLEHHELVYQFSMKVDDWRYRGTKDGIMTSLFVTYSMGGNPKAGDDLNEIHWFKFEESTRAILQDCHKPLFDKLLKTLK